MSEGDGPRPSFWTTGIDGVHYYGATASCSLGALLSLVFAGLWWTNAVTEGGSGYAAYLTGGLDPALVWEGEVFRIFTAPLLHVAPYHFLANLAGLMGLGATLEAQIGGPRTLLVVGLSMFAGSVATIAVSPGASVVVGASGGVFGVFGAWGTLALRQRRSPTPLLRRVRWCTPIALLADSVLAFLFPAKIGWASHFGGFAGGMAAMALLSRGAGPIPLRRSPHWMRWLAVGLAALFLWAIAVDVRRVASGRICEVLDRDWNEANRKGFTAALRDMPVDCANLEPEPPPATR
jgi:membrane associated rhomboid family serine protease